MIKIRIRENGLIENTHLLDKPILKKLKEEFTIGNPLFSKKQGMGLEIFGTPQYLDYWKSPEKNTLQIPIGGVKAAIDILTQNGINLSPDNIDDQRTTNSDESFFARIELNIKLRGYQQDAEDACLANNSGVIRAKTGSGKTAIFVSYTVKKKQNTLILVNTKELAAQTVSAFCKFTNLKEDDIGFIGSGRFEPKPITIGILQTITGLDGEELQIVQNYFGQLITDEVHIIAANTYYEASAKLPFKHKFGFSATPRREDGLTKVIFWATGDIIHTVPDSALVDFLIEPAYKKVDTQYYFPLFDTSEFQAMITDLSENPIRNKLIADTFQNIGEDRPSCFLCDRVSQTKLLEKLIPNSVILTGKTKDRPEVMEALRSKKTLHVISTWGLFSTGIDLPHLEILYLCSPKKAYVKLKQAKGRLMRQAEGKTEALIVDFVDTGVWLLYNQWKTRHKILTS